MYKYITIGNQTWMAENLKFITLQSKCYENFNSNCEKYGRGYNGLDYFGGSWQFSSSNPSGIQGICPKGWHIPSTSEWQEFFNYIGFKFQIDLSTKNGAKKAVEILGNNDWISVNTSNQIGFNLEPSGFMKYTWDDDKSAVNDAGFSTNYLPVLTTANNNNLLNSCGLVSISPNNVSIAESGVCHGTTMPTLSGGKNRIYKVCRCIKD